MIKIHRCQRYSKYQRGTEAKNASKRPENEEKTRESRGKDDLIKVANSTGKIRSSRRMPQNSIEK